MFLFFSLFFSSSFFFFFFNDTATTEIYTLSLHDALPISFVCTTTFSVIPSRLTVTGIPICIRLSRSRDRKSTRLNSSHSQISYAVFCLKKKKKKKKKQLILRKTIYNQSTLQTYHTVIDYV